MKNLNYARVVLPHPPYQILDYFVPPHLRLTLLPGMEVLVPLQNRKTVGLVVALTSEPPSLVKIKEVIDVVSGYPILSDTLIKLAFWLSDYYLAPLNQAVRAILPSILQRRWSRVIALSDPTTTQKNQAALKEEEKSLLSYLEENEEIDYEKIKRLTNLKNPAKVVKSLLQKGLVISIEKLTRPAAQTKKMLFVRVNKPVNLKGLTAKQQSLLQCLENGKEISLAALTKQEKVTSQTVRSLEKKNRLSIYDKVVKRSPLFDISVPSKTNFTLNSDQDKALKTILPALTKEIFKVFLLHGVTGSGKTEVYIRAVAQAIKLKKTALVLLPEIALTPLLISRFEARFPNLIAVWHSRLSEGERFDEWRRIAKGEAKVVIGARSALFAPLSDLGVIVVDEEHESSYKQTESPHYNGRDVAIKRAQLEKAVVILGSATPSLESYYNTLLQKNHLLSLPLRIEERPLPRTRIIDLREENLGVDEIFSSELVITIDEKLSKGEQAIIFLNRRGFAPFVLCSGCGEAILCPECEVSLVHHLVGEREELKCHHCFYHTDMPRVCPNCQSEKLRLIGWGTQRVETELQRLFPKAGISRLDTDTTTRKGAYKRIYKEFATGKTDILLGTQMVAKGFDFPKVTLVGVVLADTSLHLPDFRAAERTFQLLTQVAGRTGRSARGGEVIIQTYLPEHYSLAAASRHNYEEFYAREISLRRELMLPPICRMINLVLSGENEIEVESAASELADKLRKRLGEDVVVLGPGTPVIHRVQNQFRYQLIIKGNNAVKMKAGLKKCLLAVKKLSKINCRIDVDPISIF